ncbi:hypothetical protein ATO8_19939 [Roseivivax marinus]|uniref:Uncharacterized protein n=1 Tax=Roseivivax marinus TaxID=1379903 RepID=W4HEU7_9RHOB|nr:hypothetical protein [Roseivivax marinus]ETW10903.1 hypothetical protein ATO8_19939 [Roseivivax marinus]
MITPDETARRAKSASDDALAAIDAARARLTTCRHSLDGNGVTANPWGTREAVIAARRELDHALTVLETGADWTAYKELGK